MGWEIFTDRASWDPAKMRVAFMCNTADIAFGPVHYFPYMEKQVIYSNWEQAGLPDPRGLSEEHLEECIWSLKAFMGIEVEE